VMIGPTTETIVLVLSVVNVPLASAKRPVPPVIVKTPVLMPVDSAPVTVKVAKVWSPFAHTTVSVPTRVNVFGPVMVNVKALWKVALPQWLM
jgi:hypothetical protein